MNFRSLELPKVTEVLKCKVSLKKLARDVVCHLKSVLILSFAKKLNSCIKPRSKSHFLQVPYSTCQKISA